MLVLLWFIIIIIIPSMLLYRFYWYSVTAWRWSIKIEACFNYNKLCLKNVIWSSLHLLDLLCEFFISSRTWITLRIQQQLHCIFEVLTAVTLIFTVFWDVVVTRRLIPEESNIQWLHYVHKGLHDTQLTTLCFPVLC